MQEEINEKQDQEQGCRGVGEQGKPVWLSKVAWVNFLFGLSAGLALLVGPDFPVPLDEGVLKVIVIGQAVVNLLLRFVTNGPVRVRG